MPKREYFYRRLAEKVVDGTKCDIDSYDICVDGRCEVRKAFPSFKKTNAFFSFGWEKVKRMGEIRKRASESSTDKVYMLTVWISNSVGRFCHALCPGVT